ncbi:MAG TPA: hypothetical protein VLD63_03815 [Anaerolineales bacterium]|nr:hypothetical protein [Anaerolineales bacterium]
MVLIDGSEQAWQAAFLGYDLAVHGGTRLIGAVPSSVEGETAKRLLVEFRTGARAAGVRFRTSRPRLANDIFPPEDCAGLTALLLARSGFRDREHLAAVAGSLPAPFWIVPAYRDLKQALVLHDLQPSPRLIEVANAFARTWNWTLEEWWLASSSRSSPRSSDPGSVRIDPEDLLRQSTSLPGDLCIVAWPPQQVPIWELLTRLDRPLLVIPSP